MFSLMPRGKLVLVQDQQNGLMQLGELGCKATILAGITLWRSVVELRGGGCFAGIAPSKGGVLR